MYFSKKISLLLLTLFFIYGCNNSTKDTTTKLKILTKNLNNGIKIVSIKNQEKELLNSDANLSLFNLTIKNIQTKITQTISAQSGWKDVTIQTHGDLQTIKLSNPINGDLPTSLEAIITIKTVDKKSQWDLSVKNLGDSHSLIETSFPVLNIKTDTDGTFFIPYHFGQEISNPAKELDRQLTYPRGWGATMQFLAYYNDNKGLYFGFHDKKASLKTFYLKSENGGVKLNCTIPAENQTLPNNDWQMLGHFELDFYDGNWYEASLLYKKWASKNAEYWPKNTPKRDARQAKIGSIGIWAKEYIRPYNDMNLIEKHVRDFKDFLDDGDIDIPVAVFWNEWYDFPHDYNYPEIFPPLEGFTDVINRLKTSYADSILLAGYMNGFLYDTEHLASYEEKGFPSATKELNNTIFSQTWRHKDENDNDIPTIFAVMCPTQTPWQQIMINSVKQMSMDIGLDGVYVDQVTAASPKKCMDKSHNHPLGGGHFWRDGYKKMFEGMHKSIDDDKFILSEGANDFLVDEVDGFLTEEFVTHNQVPAMMAVYGGKVQFIGPTLGWSLYRPNDNPDSEAFYGRLAQSFSYGIQIGRIYMSVAWRKDSQRTLRAANYLKQLARLRVKFKEFLSFGQMQKPLKIDGDIPTVEFTASKLNGYKKGIKIPAIQTSTWSNGKNILVTFINAKSEDITFSFDFDSKTYGINESISIKEVTQNNDGTYENISNQFTKTVTLKGQDGVGFIVTPSTKN